jgi:hypothetical protein
MIITLNIHRSWLGHQVLTRIYALEEPRAAGDDGDDLGELLEGIDDPEPAPPPALKPMPDPTIAGRISGSQAPPPAKPAPAAAAPPKPAPARDGMTPRTGRELYKVACDRKALPAVNRIGKAHGWPKLVTDWSPEQAAAAYRELTEGPADLSAPK